MIQYKYKKEIADEYGFTVKTLTRKLKNNKVLLTRGLLSAEQQKQIYDELGYPPEISRNDYKTPKDE